MSNLGSMDNVTVMIVLIHGGEAVATSDEGGSDSDSELRHNTELSALSQSTTFNYADRATATPSPSFTGSTFGGPTNGYSESPVTVRGET